MKKLLFTLLLAVSSLTAWAEEEYYLVGGCTDSGWNTGEWQRSAVRAYTADGTNWAWAGYISAAGDNDDGRFKIPSSIGGWDGFWAPEQNTVITAEGVDLSTNSSGDNKFRLAETGYYLITFNTSDKKIYAQKLTEPSKDSDYFLISSVNDYYYFAAYIATDDTKNAKARLTADLSFEEKTFTPMASDKHKFKGEFDGNGHTIDYAVVNATSYGKIGLFTYLADGANIHDLIMGENCSFEGTVKVGGIAGYARDGGEVTLTNIINKANVTSTGGSSGNEGNTAGFIACATDNTIITATNCGNMGEVHGQDGQCAAFCGWSQDRTVDDVTTNTTFTNCWNSGTIYNTEGTAQLYRNSGKVTATNCYDASASTSRGQGTLVDASTVSSGILGIKLNLLKTSGGDWYQTVGTDNNPVPFSVSPHAVHTAISVTPADGWYEISQPWQLRWMAEAINEKNSTYRGANYKLTADIDYSEFTSQEAMIGKPSNVFAGTFDGQNHTVTVEFNNTTAEETGLFRRINSGTVRNLKVAGSITTNQKLAGGICSGIWERGTIENCESAVTITDSGSGDATHGGILAAVRGTNDAYTINIQNCLFSGTLDASGRTGSAGIVGWTSNSNTLKVKNCLVTGTLTIADNGDNGVIVRSTCDGENNYYTCSAGGNLNKDYVTEASAKKGTGELCYLLNGQVSGGTNWRQTIGTDAAPTPFNTSSVVYANGSFQCDGVTPTGDVTYANTENHSVADHSFGANNLCSACKAVGQEPGTSDGAYQIGSIGHLVWFASHVNAGNTTANGVLTANIAQGDAKYVPIGTEDNVYVGHFDGQGHTVDLALNNPDKNYQGLFGVITDGVFIEKVVVTGYVNGNNYVGGIAGGTKGSNSGQKTNIWYCGNEATITAAGANGAGIIGVNMAAAASVIVTNCYNKGNITGNRESGAISGWLGDGKSSARNCYNSGTVNDPAKGFCRNGGAYFTNCYFTTSSGTDNTTENHDHGQPTEVADAAVASGLLCAKLGYGFRQNLGSDTYPNFNVDHGFVNQITSAGYSTQYNIHSDVEIPEGVEAFAGVKNGDWLTLEPIEEKIKAGEPVVLKLKDGVDPGFFNFMPTTGADEAEHNDLLGSNGEVEFGETTYVLANKKHGVGFYVTEDNGKKVPEGRAYLEITGTGVKEAYLFNFDESETGIDAIDNGELTIDGAIYNLAGQRVGNGKLKIDNGQLKPGIYIVNGKKVLF
ncbi:MAG: hypothetical protein J6W52_05925 [Bacteroidaceae bacterium]|nr:hypothetical protein [Bacteroidaceae bacterium]